MMKGFQFAGLDKATIGCKTLDCESPFGAKPNRRVLLPSNVPILAHSLEHTQRNWYVYAPYFVLASGYLRSFFCLFTLLGKPTGFFRLIDLVRSSILIIINQKTLLDFLNYACDLSHLFDAGLLGQIPLLI